MLGPVAHRAGKQGRSQDGLGSGRAGHAMTFEGFIRRPIATSLLAIGVMLIGLVAYFMLPVAALPQVDFPTINVDARLPGASADTMASSIATPLERAFSDISGVTEMTSSSSLGVTQITLQFDLSKDIDSAAQDVQSAINAAAGSLPKNMPSPPVYTKSNPADSPIAALTITSPTLSMSDLGRVVEDLVYSQIAQVKGGQAIAFAAHSSIDLMCAQ